jgi:hypothetical protein
VKRPILPALLLVAALAGCGSDDAAPVGDDTDARGTALACIADQNGIDARLDGDDEIALGGAASGAHIRFYLTAGEAEAAQFEGDGEGAEQIGPTLLYVNRGSDELLQTVEGCLAEL